jgi:hypothetical protein
MGHAVKGVPPFSLFIYPLGGIMKAKYVQFQVGYSSSKLAKIMGKKFGPAGRLLPPVLWEMLGEKGMREGKRTVFLDDLAGFVCSDVETVKKMLDEIKALEKGFKWSVADKDIDLIWYTYPECRAVHKKLIANQDNGQKGGRKKASEEPIPNNGLTQPEPNLKNGLAHPETILNINKKVNINRESNGYGENNNSITRPAAAEGPPLEFLLAFYSAILKRPIGNTMSNERISKIKGLLKTYLDQSTTFHSTEAELRRQISALAHPANWWYGKIKKPETFLTKLLEGIDFAARLSEGKQAQAEQYSTPSETPFKKSHDQPT